MKEKRTIQNVTKIMGAFFRDHRRMPTYSEMMALLNVRSKSVVHFWMKELLSEGHLEKDAKGFLKLSRPFFGLPMVGYVAAGFPSPAEEELRDVISMDEVSEKYGKHSIHLGASHFIEVLGKGKRGEPTAREKTRFPGETKRRHLSIPVLHMKV
jgi:hypothetical protein